VRFPARWHLGDAQRPISPCGFAFVPCVWFFIFGVFDLDLHAMPQWGDLQPDYSAAWPVTDPCQSTINPYQTQKKEFVIVLQEEIINHLGTDLLQTRFLLKNHPRAHKTALKLHSHSVHYAHKLTTTRCAKNWMLSMSGSGAGGCQPPSRSPLVIFFLWWGRLTAPRANVSPFP